MPDAVRFSGIEYTVYDKIGKPPVSLGGENVMLAVRLPGVTAVIMGKDGEPPTKILGEG